MKTCNRICCLAVVFVLCVQSLIAAMSEMTQEQEEFLSLLGAKDAQFDNVLFKFSTSGNHTIKPSWKYPEPTEDWWKAVIIPYRYIVKCIVRGPNATFIKELDPTVKPPEGARWSMGSFSKSSNKDNLIRDLSRINPGQITGILNISPRGPGADGTSNYLRNIQFAFGFGFGKRIKTIERVEHTDAGTELEGTILIWNDDKSRFKLILDDNLIVRQATIDCNADGNLTRFEIKTKGTIRKEGFVLAKTGTFKGRGEPYDVEFLDIQPNLSVKLYEELTDMTPEKGMQVNDRVAGRTYFALGGGRITYRTPEGVQIELDDAAFLDCLDHSSRPFGLAVMKTDTNDVDSVVPNANWEPEQATGKPDTHEAGDVPTAWASLTQDDSKEWLVLEYEKSVVPVRVDIYETYNPGAVYKVCVFTKDGKEVVAWTGNDPTKPGSGKGISEIAVNIDFKTNRVKIYLDSPKVRGWNEIDAVGLVDNVGRKHWAAMARASSTFAKSGGRP